MFELKNISRQFHGEYALRDVSLTMGGGLHFLTGPSGGGKTTLLNIMTGMERDFEGQAFYCGQDLKGLTGRESAEDLRRPRASLFLLQLYQHLLGSGCAAPLRRH